ncbi:MAG: rhodanese domain-containing protein [Rickettsiaceae bacterium]|nr:MAG: rhodanese domain-containing protein [Rickettsiaceae bacterium]
MSVSDSQVAILSFYSFIDIEQLTNLRQEILLIGKKKHIRGVVIIAKEGFNGSVSGEIEDLSNLINIITTSTKANFINSKINWSNKHPFQKLKVKIKNEIVTMGISELSVKNLRGQYIETHLWDEFINDENTVIVDTRNNYEVSIGKFKGALNPNTDTFREFPTWVEHNKQFLQGKKIAMYCTGGIRCEKSTAYLKQLGYTEVYHLKGGILQYLEDNNQNNTWEGECFVFDDRKALDHNLSPADGYWLQPK